MTPDQLIYTDPLIESCRQGNRSAQSELFQRYNKSMFHVALRIVQNREDAEDLLHDSFIDAFQKMSTFRGDATFGAWIKRIVINKSINFVKKKKLVEVELFDEIIEDENEDEQSTDDFPFSVEEVKQAMKKLSEGYRIVFSLYLFEDYSHKQIADQLGITESTSKSQLNRAKKRLIELMTQN